MPIATKICRVGPDGVALMELDNYTTYQFDPITDQQNVIAGFIAVPGDFNVNSSYVHRIFPYGTGQPITFTPLQNGVYHNKVYFYVLLPIKAINAGNPAGATYIIGSGDGEVQSGTDEAATLQVKYAAEIPSGGRGNQWINGSGTSYVLPAELIEFASGHSAVIPMATQGDQLMHFIQINGTHKEIQVQGHLIAGVSGGNHILDIITPQNESTDWIDLREGTPSEQHAVLIGLVAPKKTVTGGVTTFTFELGDPKRTATVSATRV